MPAVISTHFSVGYMVPIDLLCTLCDEYDSIIGINCSIGQDFTYLVRLLDEVNPRVEVHVGGPMHALSALAMGGTGYLSSEGNLVPQLVNRVVEHYAAGEYEAAGVAYAKVMQVFTLLSSRVAVKALLKAVGLPGGEPRPPRSCSPPRTTRGPASPSWPPSASPSSRADFRRRCRSDAVASDHLLPLHFLQSSSSAPGQRGGSHGSSEA